MQLNRRLSSQVRGPKLRPAPRPPLARPLAVRAPRRCRPAAAGSDPKHISPEEPKQRPLPPPSGEEDGSSDGRQRRPHVQILQWLRRRLGNGERLSPNVARILSYARVFLLGCLSALVLSGVRTYTTMRARTAPREVLYSDFITMVDQKRVRAARLEAGTGKVYFDIHLPTQQQHQQEPQQQPTAAAAAAAEAAKDGKQAATTAAATAGAAAAAATADTAAGAAQSVLPARAKRGLSKHFYVKVADKTDPLLVSRLLAAGIEFGVSRPGLHAQLANVMVTTLALWLSLLPLLFVLRRLVDARSGGSQRKKKANGGAPPVTFADVAGESLTLMSNAWGHSQG